MHEKSGHSNINAQWFSKVSGISFQLYPSLTSVMIIEYIKEGLKH